MVFEALKVQFTLPEQIQLLQLILTLFGQCDHVSLFSQPNPLQLHVFISRFLQGLLQRNQFLFLHRNLHTLQIKAPLFAIAQIATRFTTYPTFCYLSLDFLSNYADSRFFLVHCKATPFQLFSVLVCLSLCCILFFPEVPQKSV